MTSKYVTVGEIARSYQVATWQVRRAIDALGRPIPRAGLYRLVPRRLVPLVEKELRRRGHCPEPNGPKRKLRRTLARQSDCCNYR
jgi:hypothetical protein